MPALFDAHALHLSTTTDHLPGDGAANFSTLTGTAVRRVYVVRNDGLLPLTHITLHDPNVPTSSAHCDGGHGPAGLDDLDDLGSLGPLSWRSCTITFTAQPGVHRETVSATATVPLFHRSVSDSASAGYTAVQPGLHASVTLKAAGASAEGLPANKPATATITVTNSGTVPLNHVTASASSALPTLDCAASGSPTIAALEPGKSATCDAPFTTAPGKQSADVTVTGTWFWTRPITAQGPQPPRHVSVHASANTSYTGFLPPPPPSPSPTPPAPTHKPAAVVPPPPAPPSPTPQRPTPARPTPPRPTPPPTPAPSPTHAVLEAAQQYQPSRGLPLPLKVVAIVIVPAVAVGARRAVANR